MPFIKYLNDLFMSDEKFTHDNSIIICGAGISKDSSLPLGDKIIERIYEDFSLGELKDFFLDISDSIVPYIHDDKCTFFKNPRLEVLFNGIKQVTTKHEYRNYIYWNLFKDTEKNTIENTKLKCNIYPNYNHFIIANYIHNKGKCITFNFDELLESAYHSLYGDNLNCCAFPQTSNSDYTQLIKAHGTFENDDNQVFNIGIDTDNLYINGFSKQNSLILSRYFENISNIILIGYSMSDTLDLIPFLQQHYKNRKVNFYYFNFKPEINEDYMVSKNDTDEFVGHFQFNYFLKDVISEFFYINYNPNNKFCHLASIPQNVNCCEYVIDQILVNEVVMKKKEIVKLSILENLSLINKLGNIEILDKRTDFYKKFSFEKENREGNYWNNSIYIIKEFLKHPSINNYNRVFGILNELFFLTPKKKKIAGRIGAGFVIMMIWISLLFLKYIIPNKNHNSTSINRNLYMLFYRLCVFFRANNIVTKFIAKRVIKQMTKTIRIAIENNNLKHYRYAKKDKIKLEYILYRDKEKAINEIFELLSHNLDTNHFIDVTNLLKTKYEISNDENDKEIFMRMAQLTNDNLNLSKI